MSRDIKWLRPVLGNRGKRFPRSRKLTAESLENREMMAINLYVDFGDGFAGGAWNVSDSDMQSVNGPSTVDHDDNPATAKVALFGAGYRLISLDQGVRNRNVDLTGDGSVNRADTDRLISQVLATMQRTFEPLGVNIVVRAAANIQDVKNALASSGSNDAYMFLCGDAPAIAGALGIAPLNTNNTLDNAGFAFASSVMNQQPVGEWGVAIASVASHEAAHSFGVDHTDGTQMIVTGDVMDGAGFTAGDYDGVNLFSRYPMPVAGGGTLNAFEVLASSGFVGVPGPTAPGYVTGTGAHDRITITRRTATSANVLVQPFSNANLTGALPSFSYIVNMTNGIIVEGGFNNDRIVIAGNLGTVVAVRGGAGIDTIQLNSPTSSVSVARTQIKSGSTTINFIEAEAINVQGGGATIMSVRGADATKPQSIVLDAASVTGVLPWTVSFSGLSSLSIEAGAHGNSIQVNNTPANATTNLFTGLGVDFVEVLKTSGNLNVYGQNGADEVTIGRAATVGGLKIIPGVAPSIAQTLTISNYSSYSKVTINDSAATAARSIVMGGDSSYGEVRGLGPSGSRIRYVTADTRSLDFVGGSRGYQFTINNTPLHAAIRTGGGQDRFQINRTTAPLSINAGGGANQFIVGNFRLSGIIGALDLRGAGGVNRYEFSDIGETIGQKYYLNGGSLYRTDANGSNQSGIVTFRDAASLDIYAGSGGNVIYVQDTPVLSGLLPFTNLYSGEGGDFVSVSRTTGELLVNLQHGEFDQIDIGSTIGGLDPIHSGVVVTGAGGSQSLRVNDAGHAAGRALVVTGDTIERDGEALIALLDWRPQSLTLSAGGGDDIIEVRGNPAMDYTLLEGGNGANLYRIGSEAGMLSNLGNVSILGGDDVDTVELHDEGETAAQSYVHGNYYFPSLAVNGTFVLIHTTVENAAVIGGQGNDVFQIEQPGGGPLFSLDGGDGRDTLNYSSYASDVIVDLAAGTATDVAQVVHFENVIGGGGADYLVGDGSNNVLVGNGGANYLVGGAGRDVLIAGAESSVLLGGEDDDLLLGGVTAFDGEPAALDAIMAEWADETDYATRLEHLRFGGGLNGDALLNPDTVARNGGSNWLVGDEGEDLFAGSRWSDANDWDEPLGEVFLDEELSPDVVAPLDLSAETPVDYSAYDVTLIYV